MAQPIFFTQQQMSPELVPARRIVRAIVVSGGVLGAAFLLCALVLWFNYGTAVFFEMIASGISACF